MLDLLYIGITVFFFALAVAYVAGCDRLAPSSKASGSERGRAS